MLEHKLWVFVIVILLVGFIGIYTESYTGYSLKSSIERSAGRVPTSTGYQQQESGQASGSGHVPYKSPLYDSLICSPPFGFCADTGSYCKSNSDCLILSGMSVCAGDQKCILGMGLCVDRHCDYLTTCVCDKSCGAECTSATASTDCLWGFCDKFCSCTTPPSKKIK